MNEEKAIELEIEDGDEEVEGEDWGQQLIDATEYAVAGTNEVEGALISMQEDGAFPPDPLVRDLAKLVQNLSTAYRDAMEDLTVLAGYADPSSFVGDLGAYRECAKNRLAGTTLYL